MSKLNDKGFCFRYNKLSNGRSWLSIEEGQAFDFSKPSTLFRDINDVLHSFDMTKNYYSQLPRDLQSYSSIIKNSENDEFLKTDETDDYFQMGYEVLFDGYEYSILTSDIYYNSIAKKSNFIKMAMNGMFPYYTLKVTNREMAIQNLNEFANNIQTFGNIQKEVAQRELVKGEELEINFEYNETTRSNPLLNQLKVEPGESLELVAKKLRACREKEINAFAIFNGVEVNNYKSGDPQQIIKEFEQKIMGQNEAYEHFSDTQSQHDVQKMEV